MRHRRSLFVVALVAGAPFLLAGTWAASKAEACETSGCGPEPGFYPDAPLPQVPIISEVFTIDQLDRGVRSAAADSLRVGTSARPEETSRIVARLDDAFRFCAALQSREYAVDCISERLERIAAALPTTGDYAPVRTALDQATSRLNGIVEANRSTVLPAGRARSTGAAEERTSRPLRPTATERTDQAVAQAATVLRETQTVLLLDTDDPAQEEASRSVSGAIEAGTVLLFAV